MREKGLSGLLIILAVGLLIYVSFLFSTLKNKANLSQNTTASQPTPTSSMSKIDYLRSKGLHVDPVAIKMLELSKQWQDKDNDSSLFLNKAYLTPTLVENLTQYAGSIEPGKNILVLEASIRDLRIQGNPREIKFQEYFRLRENQKDYSPTGYLYSWLPQEDKTIYVIFSVEPNIEQFKLMLGPFSHPAILNLDFKTAQETSGVINGFDGGFSPKFNESGKLMGVY